MAGGLGGGNFKEACRRSGMNNIDDKLEEADMVRTFKIMYSNDKVEKTPFWKMAEAREGLGRRKFREKEV